MRNLFTALKQDTHAKHNILENTFPFSIFHEERLFDDGTYNAILQIMGMFHQTTAEAVQQAEVQAPELRSIVSMLNSNTILDALRSDIHALGGDELCVAPHASIVPFASWQAAYNDIHPNHQLLPKFNSPISQAISATYVWLGSSMGANIIVRRLQGMQHDIPTNYYQAMASCAKGWVSFKQEVGILLPKLGLDNNDFVIDVVEDANAWFNYLISSAEIIEIKGKPKAIK